MLDRIKDVADGPAVERGDCRRSSLFAISKSLSELKWHCAQFLVIPNFHRQRDAAPEVGLVPDVAGEVAESVGVWVESVLQPELEQRCRRGDLVADHWEVACQGDLDVVHQAIPVELREAEGEVARHTLPQEDRVDRVAANVQSVALGININVHCCTFTLRTAFDSSMNLPKVSRLKSI